MPVSAPPKTFAGHQDWQIHLGERNRGEFDQGFSCAREPKGGSAQVAVAFYGKRGRAGPLPKPALDAHRTHHPAGHVRAGDACCVLEHSIASAAEIGVFTALSSSCLGPPRGAGFSHPPLPPRDCSALQKKSMCCNSVSIFNFFSTF